MKKYLLSLAFLFLCVLTAVAGDEEPIVISGAIQEISESRDYMTIGNKKIMVSQDLLDESFMEEGDKVRITAEESEGGLKAIDYEYIFEDDSEDDEDEIEIEPEYDADEIEIEPEPTMDNDPFNY